MKNVIGAAAAGALLPVALRAAAVAGLAKERARVASASRGIALALSLALAQPRRPGAMAVISAHIILRSTRAHFATL